MVVWVGLDDVLRVWLVRLGGLGGVPVGDGRGGNLDVQFEMLGHHHWHAMDHSLC